MTADRWISDTERHDGLTIYKRADENWSIRSSAGAVAIDRCPCCDEPIASARRARRIADWFYVPETPPAAA